METAKRPIPHLLQFLGLRYSARTDEHAWFATLQHYGHAVKERTVHSRGEAIRASHWLLKIATTLLQILVSPIVGAISFCVAFGSRTIRGLQRLNHEDHVTEAWLRQYRGREHER